MQREIALTALGSEQSFDVGIPKIYYADIADNCLALANGRFCEAGRIDCLYRLSKFDKIIGLTLLN
jgi:hypothetical protein